MCLGGWVGNVACSDHLASSFNIFLEILYLVTFVLSFQSVAISLHSKVAFCGLFTRVEVVEGNRGGGDHRDRGIHIESMI